MMVGRMFNPSMNDLMNRLTSFTQWPNNVAVKPKDLAEAGFYYVGIADDTVCCFSCGGRLNGWQVGDIPEERHRRLSGNRCEFLQRLGMDTLDSSSVSGWNRNILTPPMPSFDPIDDDMENEDQRLRSFQRNNGWRGAVEPRKLAAAGFYYTGIHDHVRCFACDVSLKAWQPGDDPVKEHLKIEPNCTFISRFANRFSISHTTSLSLQETGPTQPKFGQTYRSTIHDPSIVYLPPVSKPANRPPVSMPANRPPVSTPANWPPVSKPNYASEHARLHTFINWPKDCPVQPKELIDAGFYYTGNGDKVECFKCGIILAGWEPQDTPWGEHKKWSKDCPLVVEHLRRRNPHSPIQGPRPPVSPQEQTWKTPPKVLDPPSPVVGPSEMEDEMKPSNVVRLPSEQSECSKMGEQNRNMKAGSTEEEIFYLQKGVQKLIEDKQYDYETINEAIQQKTKIEGELINSMAELIDAIQSYQEMSNRKRTTVDKPVASKDPSAQPIRIDPEALHKHVQKLEDAHRCKICLDAEIGIVFLPCGHLVCCPKCAHEIQAKRDSLCPICRRHIDSIIRTYLT